MKIGHYVEFDAPVGDPQELVSLKTQYWRWNTRDHGDDVDNFIIAHGRFSWEKDALIFVETTIQGYVIHRDKNLDLRVDRYYVNEDN